MSTFESGDSVALQNEMTNRLSSDNAEAILKPLSFILDGGEGEKPKDADFSICYQIDCLICSAAFEEVKDFKQHLKLEHKLIIAETRKIAYLRGYIQYWKKIFASQPYQEICSSFCVNSSEKENSIDRFYLLGDAIPEDKSLREKLKRMRLESVLKQHEIERKDNNFKRNCLYCSKQLTGDREIYFDHLSTEHGLFVGQVNNIVYVSQFLDVIDEKINKKFECLLCGKIFKDSSLVKEHMRKKQHRALNPKNQEYDKFYLINYLEVDKKWEEIMNEDDTEIQDLGDDSDELWGGGSRDHEMDTVCLFCPQVSHDAEIILLHMKEAHDFDIAKIKKIHRLNYYKQVKLINYIRREVHDKRCFSCLRQFENQEDLLRHLTVDRHIAFIPELKCFDQPQYFFPTYENDNLLCALSDDSPDGIVRTDLVEDNSDWLSADSVLWNEVIRLQLQ